MVYPVYSYRDVKTGFGAPHIEANDPAAVRSFSAAINMDSGVMSFSPSDFDLYKIGEFDMNSGELIPCIPKIIVSGQSVVKE